MRTGKVRTPAVSMGGGGRHSAVLAERGTVSWKVSVSTGLAGKDTFRFARRCSVTMQPPHDQVSSPLYLDLQKLETWLVMRKFPDLKLVENEFQNSCDLLPYVS